jgi:hypothetical protein
MQRTQFRAKRAKNDLKPTEFLKRNFSFETKGVYNENVIYYQAELFMFYYNVQTTY